MSTNRTRTKQLAEAQRLIVDGAPARRVRMSQPPATHVVCVLAVALGTRARWHYRTGEWLGVTPAGQPGRRPQPREAAGLGPLAWQVGGLACKCKSRRSSPQRAASVAVRQFLVFIPSAEKLESRRAHARAPRRDFAVEPNG